MFQETLNVKESNDLGTYLGFPLSHKRPKRKGVQFLVDKVRKKLALWKTKYLTKAGKLTLINPALNTIPNYYLQSQVLPSTTLSDLDLICNDFLWGKKDSKNRLHLIGKDHTFLAKTRGGLGIRSHQDLSKIYMSRLGWRMSQGVDNLAKECIISKYIQPEKTIHFKKG